MPIQRGCDSTSNRNSNITCLFEIYYGHRGRLLRNCAPTDLQSREEAMNLSMIIHQLKLRAYGVVAFSWRFAVKMPPLHFDFLFRVCYARQSHCSIRADFIPATPSWRLWCALSGLSGLLMHVLNSRLPCRGWQIVPPFTLLWWRMDTFIYHYNWHRLQDPYNRIRRETSQVANCLYLLWLLHSISY
jgi:hypothetical protein